jgi:hypothetical protein
MNKIKIKRSRHLGWVVQESGKGNVNLLQVWHREAVGRWAGARAWQAWKIRLCCLLSVMEELWRISEHGVDTAILLYLVSNNDL